MIDFIILAVVAFIQNMAFTWSSRSRNSGDPFYHFFVAILSNGIWFICTIFILKNIWVPLTQGESSQIILTGIIYIASTALGSSIMMKILLRSESGKKKVGSS